MKFLILTAAILTACSANNTGTASVDPQPVDPTPGMKKPSTPIPGVDGGTSSDTQPSTPPADALPSPSQPAMLLTSGPQAPNLVNPENGDHQVLCSTKLASKFVDPSYSPDKTAVVGTYGTGASTEIAIMTAACGELTQLTSNAGTFGDSHGRSSKPKFFGADLIVFVQRGPDTVVQVPTPGGGMRTQTTPSFIELYSTTPKKGAEPKQLTNFRNEGNGVTQFDLSSDGSTVCYVKMKLDTQKAFGLFCADWPMLTNERQIHDDPTSPLALSPDGKSLVFGSETLVMVADPAKVGSARKLVDCGPDSYATTGPWSPDGKRVSYSCSGAGLFVANSDGSGMHKVAGPEVGAPSDWK
jgi:Tol biopolymer transport system component